MVTLTVAISLASSLDMIMTVAVNIANQLFTVGGRYCDTVKFFLSCWMSEALGC